MTEVSFAEPNPVKKMDGASHLRCLFAVLIMSTRQGSNSRPGEALGSFGFPQEFRHGFTHGFTDIHVGFGVAPVVTAGTSALG